jgi:uncharacterized protein (TIGR00661 family)
MNIGYFISSHGFGHAARACAVMEKLSINPDIKFTIFTKTPKWFFDNSLTFDYQYVFSQTDIGLIQSTPFLEDLDKTLLELKALFPFPKQLISLLENNVIQEKISIIISDISPVGLQIAKNLNIPSILIENFTWDWIYESYLEQNPEFGYYISLLQEVYNSATIRITCEPFCKKSDHSTIVSPIFREPRNGKEEIKRKLGISNEGKIILISMGGIPIEKMKKSMNDPNQGYTFIIPVGESAGSQSQNNIIYLPHNHKYFHPDLVNASDLIVGKVGYSTITETYSLRKPFLYVGRKKFRESKILEEYIQENLISEPIEFEDIFTLDFYNKIQNLIRNKDKKFTPINGADQVCGIITKEFLTK